MTIKRSALQALHIISIKELFVLVSLFAVFTNSNAQLRLYPHPQAQHQREKRDGANFRTKQIVPLTLPFFDDFSDPTVVDGNNLYPDTSRWENSYSVVVNSGLAINPPTINVATFDGLDSAGAAYNPNEIFLNGFTDSLVSLRIDMTPTAAVPVSVAERNGVYLSFYYEWKGNGEAPDEKDYLQVQFRNQEGDWETAHTIVSTLDLDPTKFYQVIVKIDGDRFFYNAFQFRIRSFGRQSGPYDTWHLDYVYLNKNRTETDLSFPDQAISSNLTHIFQNSYRTMPYYHFLQNPELVAPKFQVFNLRGNPPDVLNYFTEGKFTSYVGGIANEISLGNLDPDPAPPNSEGINDDGTGTIFPFETKTVTVKYIDTIDTLTVLDPKADSVFIDLKINLITGDNIDPDTGLPADDYDPKYDPIDFRYNDTISNSYVLKNYYAYDDGEAEYAGGLVSAGNVFAYEFDLDPALPDTLKLLEGFDIYFPPFGLTSNQTVDFFVFDEVDGHPASVLVRRSSVSLTNKGINKFQSIRFEGTQVPTNKFYVGWRQPVAGNLVVGIDNSNDTGSRMFFNTDGKINPDPGQWERNTLIKGSFMVRPVFNTGVSDPTTGIEDEEFIAVYPNPSRGNFQIEGKTERVEITSITGQPVSFTADVQPERTFVYTSAPTGLYILRYAISGKIRTQKIVITQ